MVNGEAVVKPFTLPSSPLMPGISASLLDDMASGTHRNILSHLRVIRSWPLPEAPTQGFVPCLCPTVPLLHSTLWPAGGYHLGPLHWAVPSLLVEMLERSDPRPGTPAFTLTIVVLVGKDQNQQDQLWRLRATPGVGIKEMPMSDRQSI